MRFHFQRFSAIYKLTNKLNLKGLDKPLFFNKLTIKNLLYKVFIKLQSKVKYRT